MSEKLSIAKWASEDQPREKLESLGPSALSNAELCAILIGSGSKEESAVELMKHILNDCDNNLNTLGKMTQQELQNYKGMGPAKAITILAACELGKRRALDKIGPRPDLGSSIAIYNYMASRYTYDNKLANEITSGKITKYIPDTAATLKGTTGICYDFSSLFAAMCRSPGSPCALTKGYAGSSYHAWNKVNLNGKWYQIDLTYAVTRSVKNAKTLHDCVSPLTYTNTSDALAVAAA